MPDSGDAQEFVRQVFERVSQRQSRKPVSTNRTRRQAEELKALNSKHFGFLFDDEASSDPVKHENVDTECKQEMKLREWHLRKRDHNKQWESDEEKLRKRRKAATSSHEADADLEGELDEAQRERERLDDLKHRDAFAERMRDRDRERTTKLVENWSSKNSSVAAEAAQRRQLASDQEAREAASPSLRLYSRQEYLTKRETQQIDLLRKEIADEEALFRNLKVSQQEQRELERKKELLRLVEERLTATDKWDGHQMPEDYLTEEGKMDKKKKERALHRRYEDERVEEGEFVTDVDQWEAKQTLHSTFKSGALDKKEVARDYDYVFDESQATKFVLGSLLLPENGLSPADKLLQARIDAAKKRGKILASSSSNYLF